MGVWNTKNTIPYGKTSFFLSYPYVILYTSPKNFEPVLSPSRQGYQVQQFLKPKFVQLVSPNFITVGPTITYCGYFPYRSMVNHTVCTQFCKRKMYNTSINLSQSMAVSLCIPFTLQFKCIYQPPCLDLDVCSFFPRC